MWRHFPLSLQHDTTDDSGCMGNIITERGDDPTPSQQMALRLTEAAELLFTSGWRESARGKKLTCSSYNPEFFTTKMSKLEMFKDFINQRLTTAVLEILAAAEKSFSEFEEEISRSKEESVRLQRLLDIVIQPEVKIHRADVQQLSLLEPPQIKEEEELWTSQEEEQLQGLQSGTTDSTFTSTSVKQDWDQEDFSECSHVVVKVDDREGDSLPSNTTEEQLKAESDEQDYAAPEPDSDSQPLSAGAPDCPTAQSLEEEEHGESQGFQVTTLNIEALPKRIIPQRRRKGKTIHCQQCNKVFSNEFTLVEHMRTHTGEKPYECHECNKRFAWRSCLFKHMRIHREKPYICRKCGKVFSLKSHLVGHMKIHTKEKPYMCLECCRLFARHEYLENHMSCHVGEKPYECQQCKKWFSKSHLVIHMKTHTGEKPYECQQCIKSFLSKSHLIDHMRTHTGEEVHKCQKCNKQFVRKYSLVVHMMKHSGVKLYQYQECNKTFIHETDLLRHIMKHRRGTI